MKRNGFTLVEVLVVIAIIAIIGFGAVSVAQSVHERANVNKTKTIMSSLNGALEEYFRDTNGYPIVNGTSDSLYEQLNSNPKVSALLAGLPSDCVQPLKYDWNGDSTTEVNEKKVVIYDGWYASDDHSAAVNLADNTGSADGNGVNEPMIYINRGNGNFPQIRSAGKDRTFNTADDIVSTEL